MAKPEIQRLFVPEDGPYPFRGVNYLDPPDRMTANWAQEASNVIVDEGVIEQRKGYTALGTHISTIAGTVIGNPILALCDFESSGGTKYLVAITTKHQFVYNTTTNVWNDITKRSTARAINVVNQGTKTFTHNGTDRTSEFIAGDLMNVVGSTGNNGIYTIVSSTLDGSDTDIVVTEAIPHATADGTMAGDLEWAGTEASGVDWAVGVDTALGRVLVVTNDIDGPRYWTGSSRFVDLSFTGLSNFVTCKCVAIFKDYLVIGNVLTSSREEHFVAWSDTGDFNDFSSATTNAGSATISDSDGAILALVNHGDRLAIFNEGSIGVITHVGGDVIFSFETLAHEVNAPSTRAPVPVGPFILYPDNENIYLFDGTRLVTPIGEQVKTRIRRNLDHENKHLVFGFNDSIKRKVYWIWPLSSILHDVIEMDYNLFDIRDVRFVISRYAERPTSMGIFARDAALKWSDLNGIKWEAADFHWDEGSAQKEFPVRVIGTSVGKVFLADDTRIKDDGATIISSWSTKSFTVPQLLQSSRGRWLELEFQAKGTEVTVSAVKGFSNQLISVEKQETITLTSGWAWYKFHMDISTEQLFFIFTNSVADGWFHLRFYRSWVKGGGVR